MIGHAEQWLHSASQGIDELAQGEKDQDSRSGRVGITEPAEKKLRKQKQWHNNWGSTKKYALGGFRQMPCSA